MRSLGLRTVWRQRGGASGTDIRRGVQPPWGATSWSAGTGASTHPSSSFLTTLIDRPILITGTCPDATSAYIADLAYLRQRLIGRAPAPGLHRPRDLQTTDPPAAEQKWAEVDRKVTDLALWCTLVNEGSYFVSARLANSQYNASYGILLDQAWVK